MSKGMPTLSQMQLRELLRDAIPAESYEYGSEAPLHQFFVPKSHARALHLNTALVIGSRGAGKSFWWGALQSPDHRALVERFAPDTRIKRSTIVRPGFGKRSDLDRYPTRDVLAAQLSAGRTAREIWKTVMIWAVGTEDELPTLSRWGERIEWVATHSEEADRLLQDRDEALQAADDDLLVVFDALDWTSNDWSVVFQLVEGLLQVALEFRAYRRIRAKVFLRTDQFDDRRIARFPDASKLLASRVRLDWLVTELYALLWQLLGNHPEKSAFFRSYLQDLGYPYRSVGYWDNPAKAGCTGADSLGGRAQPQREETLFWEANESLQFRAKEQERLFHLVTGRFMGGSARTGFPYKWLPTHLADAHGEVTPRSFLVALRTAAEVSIADHTDWAFALHPHSLHAGVQKASWIRVEEISEHRWVPVVMNALQDRVLVPFDLQEAKSAWTDSSVLEQLATEQHAEVSTGEGGDSEPWLLPPHLGGGPDGVCEDLATLGVFRPMRGDRIDVPDVYRLGFGLRRKGGVKPIQRRGASR
jgi:hypothetical protein